MRTAQLVCILLLVAGWACATQKDAVERRSNTLVHMEIRDAIGPATSDFLQRGLAQALSVEPRAMQLRYLQTLTDVANERTTTLVFPLPLDLIKPLLDR